MNNGRVDGGEGGWITCEASAKVQRGFATAFREEASALGGGSREHLPPARRGLVEAGVDAFVSSSLLRC